MNERIGDGYDSPITQVETTPRTLGNRAVIDGEGGIVVIVTVDVAIPITTTIADNSIVKGGLTITGQVDVRPVSPGWARGRTVPVGVSPYTVIVN